MSNVTVNSIRTKTATKVLYRTTRAHPGFLKRALGISAESHRPAPSAPLKPGATRSTEDSQSIESKEIRFIRTQPEPPRHDGASVHNPSCETLVDGREIFTLPRDPRYAESQRSFEEELETESLIRWPIVSTRSFKLAFRGARPKVKRRSISPFAYWLCESVLVSEIVRPTEKRHKHIFCATAKGIS